MLSLDDRDLAARDTALGEFPTLLDPERFRRALADRFPQRHIGPATGTYLRYKPGTSCLAGFRTVVDGAPVDLTATTSAHPDKIRLKARDGRRGSPFETAGFRLGDRPIVVRVFPNDPELKGLRRLLAVDTNLRLPAPFDEAALVTLRYKPERRFVARIEAGRRVAVLKAHAPNRFEAARTGSAACHTSGPLVIAEVLRTDPRKQVLVQQWLPGTLLADLQGQPTWFPGDGERVGAALAEVHRQGRSPMSTTPTGATGLIDLGDALGFLAPDLEQTLRTHAATLLGAVHELAEPSTTIHGDFYSKQVLVDRLGVGVIDFDQARPGDPIEDLGNFRAHLLRDTLRGRLTPARAEAIWKAFLVGYGPLGDNGSIRLQLFIAIACLRLAPDPFRHREPEWSRRLRQLVELSIAAMAPVLRGSQVAG